MSGEYTRIPFIELQDRRSVYDKRCIDDMREEDQSPVWRTADGKAIDSDIIGSDVFVSDDGACGFFYLPHETDGWTIYRASLMNFRCTLASEPHQFKLVRDPEQVCILLARKRSSDVLVKEAGKKGKGDSYGDVVLFTRNKSRSESLVDYRKKMRDRQIPLKRAKQWEFFVDFITDNCITADALQQLVYVARDIESAREGGEPDVPANWTQTAGQGIFMASAIEG